MPAIVKVLQVNNSDNRKNLVEAIRAETEDLPIAYEVSIFKFGESGLWEVVVKSPEGAEVCRTLNAQNGDLAPEAFRKRIRELIAML